jgi:hypothetical protein
MEDTMHTSKRLPLVVGALLFSFAPVRPAAASFGALWQTPPQSEETVFVGAANMDSDVADELLYYKPSAGSAGSVLILDGGTAQVEYHAEFDSLVMNTTDPFCDIDGNGVYEITFWGVLNPGDPPRIYVIGNLGPVGASDGPAVGEARLHLAQNYPNPFRPGTTIRFTVPAPAAVRLDVFNVAGQRVRRLLDEERAAGEHSVAWDGTNEDGRPVAGGTYFYQLVVGDQAFARKAVVLK